MQHSRYRMWILLLLALSGLTACGDTTAPAVVGSAVLVQYLEANRGYNVHGGFVISAADVRTNVVTAASQYIVDIRSATDFATGHIEGAVNVALADVPAHLAALTESYDVVVIVCYSGQSAAYLTGIVRAMGFENVKSMKWGMSAWHEDFAGPWNGNISNARATEFVTGASPAKNAPGELPTLNTGFDDGAAILEARANAVIAEGFTPAKITHADVFTDPSSYYIVNFWPQSLYETTGHVPGAIDYDPATTPFLSTTDLTTLPTDQPVVVYCYTGQTSAYLSGYLRVLGYDARSLLFGTNGMIYDLMVADGVAPTFDATQIMNYDYVQ